MADTAVEDKEDPKKPPTSLYAATSTSIPSPSSSPSSWRSWQSKPGISGSLSTISFNSLETPSSLLQSSVYRDVLTVFQAAPLVIQSGSQLHPIPRLDVERERTLLRQALHRNIKLVFEEATTDRLGAFLSQDQGRILHFSSHGHPSYLAIETGWGSAQPLLVDNIRAWIALGGQSLQFVFVSACYSRNAGEAFVQAGVPHVVCCCSSSNTTNSDSEINDVAAQEFAKAFYRALAYGKRLQEAFDLAKQEVLNTPHLLPTERQREVDKFILLPEHSNHNVQIFQDRGINIPEEPTPPPQQFPPPPRVFCGRQVDMFRLLEALQTNQFLTITGPAGIGKRALVKASCQYIRERPRSTMIDDILWVPRGSNPICALFRDLFDYFHSLDQKDGSGKDQSAVWLEPIVEALRKTSRTLLAISNINCSLERLTFALQEIFTWCKDIKVIFICPTDKTIVSPLAVSESEVSVGPLDLHSTLSLFGHMCRHVSSQLDARVANVASFVQLMWSNPSNHPTDGRWIGSTKRGHDFYKLLGEGVPGKIHHAAKTMTEAQYTKLIELGLREDVRLQFSSRVALDRTFQELEDQIRSANDLQQFDRAKELEQVQNEVAFRRNDLLDLETLEEHAAEMKSEIDDAKQEKAWRKVAQLEEDLKLLKSRIRNEKKAKRSTVSLCEALCEPEQGEDSRTWAFLESRIQQLKKELKVALESDQMSNVKKIDKEISRLVEIQSTRPTPATLSARLSRLGKELEEAESKRQWSKFQLIRARSAELEEKLALERKVGTKHGIAVDDSESGGGGLTGQTVGGNGEATISRREQSYLHDMRKALQANYTDRDFTQIVSIFPGEELKHVGNLSCSLELIDDRNLHFEKEDGTKEGREHHNAARIGTPIRAEDLFEPRSSKAGEELHDIHRVLIVGNPGIGKSSLSKQLAYRWAKGEWGSQFEALFVLPVRALQKSQYDDLNLRRARDLASAICNTCFIPPSDETSYRELRDRIHAQLDELSTLVILDGLDERACAEEQLISQAKRGRHRLLILSRSYGIEKERLLADIEVEHAGLNDEQMRRYVLDHMREQDSAASLLSLLGQYDAIAAIAHVPFNLEMLCFLWRDGQDSVRHAIGRGSMPGLYRRLVEFSWERHVRKLEDSGSQPKEDHDQIFDSLGCIALEALEKGEVFISPGLIRNAVSGSVLKQLQTLQDVGFLLLQRLSGNGQYQFSHLTFQEYFAGRWLAQQLCSPEPHDRTRALSFFGENKYSSRHRNVFTFLAGEICLEKDEAGIRRLLALSNEGAVDVLGVHQILLQARFVNEWLCTSNGGVSEGLLAIEEESHLQEGLKQWFVTGVNAVRKRVTSANTFDGDKSDILHLLSTSFSDFQLVGENAPQCLAPLFDACCDESPYVRTAAVTSLHHICKAVPKIGRCQFFMPLLEMIKDDSTSVCHAARKALFFLVANASDEFIPALLLVACKDSRFHEATIEALRTSFSASAKNPTKKSKLTLETLLANCTNGDKSIRRVSVQALGAVVEFTPASSSEFLRVISSACADDDKDVRTAAASSFQSLSKQIPKYTSECLQSLLDLCCDQAKTVRVKSRRALSKVAAAAPRQSLGPLLKGLTHQNEHVRNSSAVAIGAAATAAPCLASRCLDYLMLASREEGILKGIGAVAKASPDLAPQCLAAVLDACNDNRIPVRDAGVRSLKVIVEAAPDLSSSCLNAILALVTEEDVTSPQTLTMILAEVAALAPLDFLRLMPSYSGERFSKALVKALGSVAKASPSLAPQCLEPILAACKDERQPVREAAVKSLREVSAAVPSLAGECVQPLIDACRSTNDKTRRSASFSLASLVRAAPSFAPQCIGPLLSSIEDGARKCSLYGIYSAMGALANESSKTVAECMSLLLSACKEDRWEVRVGALWGLGALIDSVGDVAPRCVDTLLEIASKDEQPRVKTAAQYTLKVFSVKHLIDSFWATRDRQLAYILVPRLCDSTVVTTRSSTTNHKKLILYTTERQPKVWDKPAKEVGWFVREITRAVDKMRRDDCSFRSIEESASLKSRDLRRGSTIARDGKTSSGQPGVNQTCCIIL